MPHAHRPITRPPPRPLSLSIPSLEIYEDATSTPAPAGPGLQYPSLEPWPSITGAEGGGGGMGRTGAEGTAGLRMLGTAGPDPFVMPSSANGGHGRPPRATHSTPVADPLIGPTGKNGNREAADAAPETTPPNATPARIWTTALTRILSSDAGFVAKHFPAHAAVPFGSGGTVNAALMAAMAGSPGPSSSSTPSSACFTTSSSKSASSRRTANSPSKRRSPSRRPRHTTSASLSRHEKSQRATAHILLTAYSLAKQDLEEEFINAVYRRSMAEQAEEDAKTGWGLKAKSVEDDDWLFDGLAEVGRRKGKDGWERRGDGMK